MFLGATSSTFFVLFLALTLLLIDNVISLSRIRLGLSEGDLYLTQCGKSLSIWEILKDVCTLRCLPLSTFGCIVAFNSLSFSKI